jgi:hypothetical protein
VGNAQFDIGPRQRQRAQPVLDMRQLGAFGAQELAPRRHVVEQVAHFHRGAGRMRVRHDLADLAALDLQQRAVFVAVAPRRQPEATHRGHRGQRLAAEAECRDRLQVIDAGDLAGRVALHRQRQFGGVDAAAIVADPDQADAAVLQVDVDAARAGIQSVLDQLLDHGRGPFHDFAGGNLVDEGVGKLADGHAGILAGMAINSAENLGSSFPRRCESSVFHRQAHRKSRKRQWIPAFAGMTRRTYGLPPALAPAPEVDAWLTWVAWARAAYKVPGGGWRVKYWSIPASTAAASLRW